VRFEINAIQLAGGTIMQRRDALKAAATVLSGAAFPIAEGASAPSRSRHTAVKPSRFPYVEAGERVTLFYKDWGSSEHIVVFVHGWPFHSDMWQYQMFSLASAGVRVVAYDQRGCGRSTDPGNGYDFDTLADDLHSVLDQLTLSNVVLVGHSIGTGQIVRYLSRHGSDRVAGIVLLSASLPYIQKSPDNPDGVEPSHFEHWRSSVRTDLPAYLEKAAKPFAPEASPGMLEWLKRMVEDNSMWAMMATNRVEVETDWREELPKIKVRTLVVHGDADRTCHLDSTGRRVAQLIPSATLKVYSGAAHGLFVTHAAALNDDLLSFVMS
jgi:pimeloyl-ACP methyl ester carboxylesterase